MPETSEQIRQMRLMERGLLAYSSSFAGDRGCTPATPLQVRRLCLGAASLCPSGKHNWGPGTPKTHLCTRTRAVANTRGFRYGVGIDIPRDVTCTKQNWIQTKFSSEVSMKFPTKFRIIFKEQKNFQCSLAHTRPWPTLLLETICRPSLLKRVASMRRMDSCVIHTTSGVGCIVPHQRLLRAK